MATAYRIVAWEQHFENNRTRELKVMAWVPVPNRFDGDGYTELLDHENGPAHFGTWVALVEVASKCDPRGTLLRDGAGGVKRPHDCASLARMTRFPREAFEAALPRLVEIGWIEVIDWKDTTLQQPAASPQKGATLPQVDASSRAREERNGTEGKGTEEQERESTRARPTPTSPPPADRGDLPERFARIFEAFPCKINRPGAERSFARAVEHERYPGDDALVRIIGEKCANDWYGNPARFSGKLHEWLDRVGWEEPIVPAAKTEAPRQWAGMQSANGDAEIRALATNRSIALDVIDHHVPRRKTGEPLDSGAIAELRAAVCAATNVEAMAAAWSAATGGGSWA